MQSAAWKKNMTNASTINSTVCVGRLLWILLSWMWQVHLSWHWESDHHGAPSCVVVCPAKKQCDPLVTLFYKVERKICIAYCHCDSKKCWRKLDLWSKLSHHHCEPTLAASRVTRNPKAFTVANEPANEWTPIFAQLCSGCQLVPSWFTSQVSVGNQGWFLEKWSLEPPDLQTSENKLKQNSKNLIFRYISYIFVKSVWISFPINAKKTLWGNTFFDEHTFAVLFGVQRSKFLHLYILTILIFVAFLQ